MVERLQVPQPAIKDNLAGRLVWQELFRERGWLWQLVVATCLINLFAVSTSLFAMQVYDRVVPTLAYTTLTTLAVGMAIVVVLDWTCLLYTSPSPRDRTRSRMPSSA